MQCGIKTVKEFRILQKNNSIKSSSSYEKRREGDRLKCNVCGENFRERHHLTRHMTAHQDRKEDGSNLGQSSKDGNLCPRPTSSILLPPSKSPTE